MTDEAYLRAVTLGEPTRADGPIHLADYDPGWPVSYDRAERTKSSPTLRSRTPSMLAEARADSFAR